MLNRVKHLNQKPCFLGVRVSADVMEWLKAASAADCRTISSFVTKLIEDRRGYERDDLAAAEMMRGEGAVG